MQLQYMKRREEKRQTDSKYVKLQEKGTDYIKTPLMVH